MDCSYKRQNNKRRNKKCCRSHNLYNIRVAYSLVVDNVCWNIISVIMCDLKTKKEWRPSVSSILSYIIFVHRRPNVSTLVQPCTYVIHMFCDCWDNIILYYIGLDQIDTSRFVSDSLLCGSLSMTRFSFIFGGVAITLHGWLCECKRVLLCILMSSDLFPRMANVKTCSKNHSNDHNNQGDRKPTVKSCIVGETYQKPCTLFRWPFSCHISCQLQMLI